MTERELLAATGDAYSSFIHLHDAVQESLARISACADRVSDSLIDQLLQDGDSWRERLLGLVLGTTRGIDQFYDSLIIGLHKTGGNLYLETARSGAVSTGSPGSNGLGPIVSHALEHSNVDLAREITGTLPLQRGYEANLKVIQTEDEMLGNLLDIKG